MSTSDAVSRPLHLRPRLLLLVGVGGAVGTAIRAAATLLVPNPPGTFPFTVLAVNLLGAFALGALLEGLTRSGPDVGWRRDVRVGVGTGVIGGFTTYSAFAGDTALLLFQGSPATGILYAFGTVALGAIATGIGILVAGAGRPIDTGSEESS